MKQLYQQFIIDFSILEKKTEIPKGNIEILTTPVFDRPWFNPGAIILFEHLVTGRRTFLDYQSKKFFWKSLLSQWLQVQLPHNLQLYITALTIDYRLLCICSLNSYLRGQA